MKLHRLATSVAATSALVLTGAVPAIADHAEPDFVIEDIEGGKATITIDGEKVTIDYKNRSACEDLAELFSDDDGRFDLVWDKTFKYEPPALPPHDWIDAELSKDDEGEWASLDVTVLEDKVPNEGEGLHVIVKGGTKANVYLGPDLSHLTAPDGKEISHFIICKVWVPEEDDETPPDEDEEKPKDEDEEKPKDEDGKGGGEPTETPAPVPTEIPAGMGNAGAGSAGTAGLVAMLAAFAAGAAVIIRRRFLTES